MNKFKSIFWSVPKNEEKIINDVIRESFEKVEVFFDKNDGIKVEVNIVSNRDKFNQLVGRKTDIWEVGYTFMKNDQLMIVIFSPTGMDLFSNHKNSDFYPILAHELTHVFSGYCLKFNRPKWLHEGIAGYVAEQYKSKVIDVTKIVPIMSLYSGEEWNINLKYTEAFVFTKFLFDKFGKEKMFEFMKKIGWNLEKNKFMDMFLIDFAVEIDKIFEEWKGNLK